MERALVAKVGTLVFAIALGAPATLSPMTARASVYVAGTVQDVPVVATASAPIDLTPAAELPEMRLPPIARSSAVAAPTFPPSEPLVADGVVIASWYGPGFYGNRTACGQTYTPEILGVAHRLFPCGTRIRITSPAGITVVVSVIDRGPYIAGRSLDLSNATRLAVSCSDLCRVRMAVVP